MKMKTHGRKKEIKKQTKKSMVAKKENLIK
jgi:hypothetical protein